MDDKEDAVIVEIEQLEDDKWKILGSSSLEDVEDFLEIKIEVDDCDTFGGYILSLLGEIPDDGEVLDVETDRLSVHIDVVQDHTIQSTIVTKKEIQDNQENKDDE